MHSIQDDHVLQYIDAYLHDVLDGETADRVEQHCRECPICSVALAEARKRLTALQALPVIEASERLIRQTRMRIARQRRILVHPVRFVWSTIAAAAVVIALVHLYYANLAPSPYDLRVLGQQELFADTDASLRVVLMNRGSDEPLSGVPIDIELAGKDGDPAVHLASFTTDALGSAAPRLRWPDWQDGQYELHVRARPGSTQELVSRTVTLRRTWQVMLSSDKPVYQPGQVIRLRSLALRRPDLKPVAGQAVVYSIQDPKGNKIFRQRSVTSRFGIASADCPLADEIIEGPYQLQCEVGGTSSSLAVEVKKYSLPKYKIDLEFDRPYYEPGERVRGTVTATYFFSQPVSGAEVDVQLESTAPVATIGQLSTRTDAVGKASFDFTLPQSLAGRTQDSGAARISLTVKLRDAAGQEQTKTETRLVTDQSIQIEVVPEAGRLVKGLVNTVYLFTNFPDGRPARTRIAISGVERELTTSEQGLAVLEFTPTAERTQWTIRASDEQGKIGRREVMLDRGAAGNDFLVRTDRAVYQGGETIQIATLGPGQEPVYIDLIKDGQTIATDAIRMANGRGQYQFDLPPELFGTVELCAYRFSAEGLPVRKTRVIYVHQARGVNLRAQLDRDQYRPGDRAKVSFTLTDDRGQPAPGALSLAAVDEAVFSVFNRRPGMEQTFFTMEQKLLEPIYAIYPWSPQATAGLKPDERQQLEQALFAATSRKRNVHDDVRQTILNNPEGGGRYLLDSLERPDWEELAAQAHLSEDVIAALRGEDSPHSLSASSYPGKVTQVESTQRHGLGAVHFAWGVLGIVAVITVLVIVIREGFLGVLVALGVIGMLMALLLPSVQSARESGRRASAANNLRMIGLLLDSSESMSKQHDASASAESPRIRQWFPETLLWRPELITDDAGNASIDIDLADAITTWRLSASAVTAEGKLGSTQEGIRVFQPFFIDLNLPVALTRGDEVSIPIVVYNYLDRPQTVELKIANNSAFELLDEPTKQVELAAGDVRSTSYRLRAKSIGQHTIEVLATGKGVADAVKRQVEVVPDGRRVEQVASGALQQPATVDVSLPDDAIPDSEKLIVRLYPSTFSELVEGLDAIFERPYGCFEQTSSTTYPNILALEYLQHTQQDAPAVEIKAREYIHLGYQRLLSFEISGGGFDWFGYPPANRTLSAYGLMEFEDMARVHDVDPEVIARTRRWLLAQQHSDGSWDPEAHGLHDDPTRRGGDLARLTTTAYIGWAVFRSAPGGQEAQATLNYLLGVRPTDINVPYALALVCNALQALDRRGASARPYLDRLDSLKHSSADGKLIWWGPDKNQRTVFYGAGRCGQIESTALATLALLADGQHPASARGALAWLIEQKDARGTWHSTQATVLALKALLAGTGRALGQPAARQIVVEWDGALVRELNIPADQAEVVQQVDLSSLMTSGTHRLRLLDRTGTATGFQVATRYHIAGPAPAKADAPLAIELTFDCSELKVAETLEATAVVTNNSPSAAPMVIIDLPISAGFAIEADSLDSLVAAKEISKYQLTPRSVIVYLRDLRPAAAITLKYRLRAIMPVKASSPPALVCEYYDPDKQAASAATSLTVTAR